MKHSYTVQLQKTDIHFPIGKHSYANFCGHVVIRAVGYLATGHQQGHGSTQGKWGANQVAIAMQGSKVEIKQATGQVN